MSTKLSLPLVIVAAVTVAGCGAEAPAPSNDEAAAVAQAEAAAKAQAKPPAEIAAPESTKLHTPIPAEDVSRLMGEAKRDKIQTDTIGFCPACHFFEPDLTVVEDDRDQTICTPPYGCYSAYAKGFVVKNVGTWDAPTFHVAVLMGSDSYGFDVPGLAVGQSIYFQITRPSIDGPACGESAVVIVNPFNAIVESNYNNNAVTIAGYCFL